MDRITTTINLPDLAGIKGWLSQKEAAVLYYGVKITAGLVGELAEIGSYCGKSTVVIGSAAREYDAGFLYSIDPHEGFWYKEVDSYQELVKNLDKHQLGARVIIEKCRSTEFRIYEPIKFLFIDGDHEYKSVKEDWLHFRDAIMIGGIVFFHDCDEEGPERVVNEILKEDQDFQFAGMVNSLVGFRRIKG